jgi:uncharacterized membrane protein
VDFLKRFGAFWYDFIVGDDWLVAVGVLVSLGVAAVLVRAELDLAAALLLPLGIAAVLTSSLLRATRAH